MAPDERDPAPKDGSFEKRLEAARGRRDAEKAKWTRVETQGPSGLGVGLRIASEIVAAIAVSVALGLMLDGLLGTKPWMLLLFILLGSGAALVNVVRTGTELERKRKEAKARAAEEAQKGRAAGPRAGDNGKG